MDANINTATRMDANINTGTIVYNRMDVMKINLLCHHSCRGELDMLGVYKNGCQHKYRYNSI